uniref:Uncharacterized protein n=1 Tax=Romanomermis culicivorax TaxID=13658 RepID=A0A915JPJ0_ROMCU
FWCYIEVKGRPRSPERPHCCGNGAEIVSNPDPMGPKVATSKALEMTHQLAASVNDLPLLLTHLSGHIKTMLKLPRHKMIKGMAIDTVKGIDLKRFPPVE